MNNLDIHKLLPKTLTFHSPLKSQHHRLYCENQTHAYLQAHQAPISI